MTQLARILTDGLILSLVASLILIATLWINPRLFLQDYPKEIQAKVPPKTKYEKRLSLMIGILFLGLLFGAPLLSTYRLNLDSGTAIPFGTLFLNAFGILWLFNLFDWLVLDWGLVTTWTPKFIVLPGTEGMAAYKNYSIHFRGFLVGTVLSLVTGLLIAGLVSLG